MRAVSAGQQWDPGAGLLWACVSPAADKRCKHRAQRASGQQQRWEPGRGELEPAVSVRKPQGIMTSIHADLKPKIPHICSVRVGFTVPPVQSLVPNEFSGSTLFQIKNREACFLAEHFVTLVFSPSFTFCSQALVPSPEKEQGHKDSSPCVPIARSFSPPDTQPAGWEGARLAPADPSPGWRTSGSYLPV